MPSRDEWRLTYAYLVEQLQATDVDESVIVEVQEAAAGRRPITDADLSAETPGAVALSSKVKKELSRLKFRAPTPREAFEAAVSVLHARLVEVPAVAEQLSKMLDRDLSQIRWEPDASESDFTAAQESFGASEMQVSPSERDEIQTALTALQRMIEGTDGNA